MMLLCAAFGASEGAPLWFGSPLRETFNCSSDNIVRLAKGL